MNMKKFYKTIIFPVAFALLITGCSSSEESSSYKTFYHENSTINRFFNEYNEIAEIEITPVMVDEGAYANNALASCNDVFLNIYANSDNGFHVDMSSQTTDGNKNMETIFKDVMRTIDPSLSDDEVNTAWNELLTGKYKSYDYYLINDFKITYSETVLADGKTIDYALKLSNKKSAFS